MHYYKHTDAKSTLIDDKNETATRNFYILKEKTWRMASNKNHLSDINLVKLYF